MKVFHPDLNNTAHKHLLFTGPGEKVPGFQKASNLDTLMLCRGSWEKQNQPLVRIGGRSGPYQLMTFYTERLEFKKRRWRRNESRCGTDVRSWRTTIIQNQRTRAEIISSTVTSLQRACRRWICCSESNIYFNVMFLDCWRTPGDTGEHRNLHEHKENIQTPHRIKPLDFLLWNFLLVQAPLPPLPPLGPWPRPLIFDCSVCWSVINVSRCG